MRFEYKLIQRSNGGALRYGTRLLTHEHWHHLRFDPSSVSLLSYPSSAIFVMIYRCGIEREREKERLVGLALNKDVGPSVLRSVGRAGTALAPFALTIGPEVINDCMRRA